jgi:glutamate-1-semialdehyde aminotransferase
MNHESSIAVAAELEACAKEIAAAAKLYQRLPAHRDALAAALDSLVEALNLHWSRFDIKHGKGGRP